jgi:hypothetical protein
VLKFEKFGETTDAGVAILGLGREEYRRCLAYHSFYYFESSTWAAYAFKPMFISSENGFELIRPPSTNANHLYELLTTRPEDLRRFLAQHDYWFQSNAAKPAFRFPFSLAYFKSLSVQLASESGGAWRGGTTFFVNNWSRCLTQYLIERFCEGCRRSRLEPLCVIIYNPGDLRRITGGSKREDQWVLELLSQKEIPYIDTAPYVLEEIPQGLDPSTLSAPNGHYNARGNALIAKAVANWYRRRQSKIQAGEGRSLVPQDKRK